jgi:ABC-type ATPase involved in cell division
MGKPNDPYPFRWEKLTLHGIGSYLNGAEIDIRPITILCGTNGSGKSTWINILKQIKSASDNLIFLDKHEFDKQKFDDLCKELEGPKDLEYPEKNDSRKGANYTYTNTRVCNAFCDEGIKGLPESHADEKLHGPVGTVGFYFETTDDYKQAQEISFKTDEKNSLLSAFLEKGSMPKNTAVRIFLTIPHMCDQMDGLTRGFKITLGSETLKYEQTEQKNPEYKSPNDLRFIKDKTQIIISCQGSEKPLAPKDKEFSTYSSVSFKRILILLNDLLCGFYPIGAIRHIFDRDEDFGADATEERYVGINGEHTHFLANKYCWNLMNSSPNLYSFRSYYSGWLKKLLGWGTCYAGDQTYGYDRFNDQNIPESPADFLGSYIQGGFSIPLKGPIDDDPNKNPKNYDGRYISDILWGDGMSFGPSSFSSGFHQIAPMIVQSGLMKPSEICAIENPEVHLHPNLQLEITNFFLEQAKASRYFIIETHSDLIIRRIIREILEEKICIGQGNIRIYFTSIEQSSESPYNSYSKIECLKVDEQGRIKNWPEGFLDESLKESQRLMKIMYKLDVPDDDGEEN